MKFTKTSFDLNDKISEIISFIFLVSSIFIIAITLPGMPDVIPSHYSITGKVDRYESKHMLWVIVAFFVAVYICLTLLSMFPGLYKKRLSGDNIEEQYRLTSKTTRTMKAVIILCFLIISYFITHNAQLNSAAYLYLAPFLIILFLIIRLGKPNRSEPI